MVEVLKNTSSIVKSNSSPGIVYKNLNIWVGTSGFATPKNIQKGVISQGAKLMAKEQRCHRKRR